MNRYRRSKRKSFPAAGRLASASTAACIVRRRIELVVCITTRSRRRLNLNGITLPDTEECANYRISTHRISTLDNQGFRYLEFFATVTVQLSC